MSLLTPEKTKVKAYLGVLSRQELNDDGFLRPIDSGGNGDTNINPGGSGANGNPDVNPGGSGGNGNPDVNPGGSGGNGNPDIYPGAPGRGETPKTGGGHPIVDDDETRYHTTSNPGVVAASFIPAAVVRMAKNPNFQLLFGALILLSIGYFIYNKK